MEDISFFVHHFHNKINFRKHGEIPTNSVADFLWWSHVNPAESNGIDLELVKNTYTTYDNFLLTG